jgi:hypothetical protein
MERTENDRTVFRPSHKTLKIDETDFHIPTATTTTEQSFHSKPEKPVQTNGAAASDDISDVLAVLRSKGGCCDCEVLYNGAEEGRLKTKYWKSRHAGLQSKASIPFQAGN